jgi:mono/diheme cytochrome c family protein
MSGEKTMRALRWIGLGAAAAVALAALAVVVLGWRSPREQYFTVNPRPVPVPAADDVDAIERGQYFAHAIAVCGVCHGPDLGGQKMSDSLIYGYIVTPNLTPGRGGVGASYDVVDWVRAIRHGVTREGRAFAFMPVDHYFHITDADLGDLIAYLESLPPVDREGGVMRLGLLPKAIINSGMLGDLVRAKIIDHDAPRPPPASSRGAYIAQVGGCDF